MNRLNKNKHTRPDIYTELVRTTLIDILRPRVKKRHRHSAMKFINANIFEKLCEAIDLDGKIIRLKVKEHERRARAIDRE